MSRIDFQNGFALGLASGGIVESGDNSRLNALESYIDDSKVIVAPEDGLADKVKTLIFYTEVFRQYYEDRKEEITVFPLIDWTKRTTAINLFDGFVNLETIMGEIDCSNITDVSNFVNALEKVKSLTFKNTKNVKKWRNAFLGCVALETLGELDFSSCEDNY
jgi:hypothetical protein